jgi:putative transposon-encoded protein
MAGFVIDTRMDIIILRLSFQQAVCGFGNSSVIIINHLYVGQTIRNYENIKNTIVF